MQENAKFKNAKEYLIGNMFLNGNNKAKKENRKFKFIFPSRCNHFSSASSVANETSHLVYIKITYRTFENYMEKHCTSTSCFPTGRSVLILLHFPESSA